MKKIFAFFFVVCVFLVSCTHSKTTPVITDDYNPGTDFQFFERQSMHGPSMLVQEIENGCIFYHDGFIYRYEQGGILPLCSKPNCLHDKETDPQQREECNACLDHLAAEIEFEVCLMLYREDLYVCYPRNDVDYSKGTEPFVVYRIPTDGSAKDQIFRHDAEAISYPLLHRGYMYYYQTIYSATGEGYSLTGTYMLCRLSIEDGKYQEEELFNADGELAGVSALSAYGNHIYFRYGYEAGPVLYDYDIRSEKIEESYLPVSVLTYYNGHMYAMTGDTWYYNDPDTPGELVCYDGPDDMSVIFPDTKQSYLPDNDGKYFYLDTSYYGFLAKSGEIRYFVYDSSFQKVDEFVLPDTVKQTQYPYDVPIGGEKYQYLVYDDEETGEWGLYIWDKSEIGTLNGKAYTQTKVPYGFSE